MKKTTHILHVINTFSEAEMEQLKTRYAYLSANGHSVKVSLLYINPSLPESYFYMPSVTELAETFDLEAKTALDKNGAFFNVDKEDHWIANGNIKAQTMRLASNLKADVILVSKSLAKKVKSSNLLQQRSFIPILTVNRIEAAV